MATTQQQLIEKVTQHVLEVLQNRDANARCSSNPNIIQETVITEETLRKNSKETKQVGLLPNAIITPSGRDYIKQNQLEIFSSVKQSVTQQNKNNTTQNKNIQIIIVDESPTLIATLKNWRPQIKL